MQTNSFPHKILWISLLSLGFAFFPFHRNMGELYSDEIKEGQSIEWTPIAGVSGYVVEVQNESEVIIEKKTVSQPSLDLKLPPGKYEFRISAINKFKKVGKVYPWKELIVKPIDSPIVRESPRVYNPNTSGKSFEAKGLYLHRGTRVILRDKSGNSFPARVETLKDGSGIVITPPIDLPDGEFKVIYQNSRGKPFQDEIRVAKDQDSLPSKEFQNQTLPGTIRPSIPETGISSSGEGEGDGRIFSMFWRQALIPGWGHYYGGYTKTGTFYFLGTLGLAGAVGSTSQSYASARSAYASAGDIAVLTSLVGSVDPNTGLLINNNLETSFNSANSKKIQATNAQAALGGFYILSLIHVIITGLTEEQGSGTSFLLESRPEIFEREIGTLYRTGVEFRF